MYDLLSKYLTGDISAEEKQILFQQLKEDEELRKEAAGIQNPLAGKSEAEGRKRGDLARGQRSTFTQQLRPDRAY